MKIFILLIFISTAANAKMYQCQDADGNIQYTQTPTAECSQEVQTSTDQSVISGVENIEEQNASEQDEQDATEALSQEEIDEKNAEIMKRNCEKANENFAVLNSDKILTKNNEDGELVIFNQEDRKQELEKIQKYIDENCVN